MTIHTIHISIHALLAESDANRAELNIRQIHFYPRSPCGERQFSYFLHIHRLLFLSTLSLRRATENQGFCVFVQLHFYPRSPCGERRHFGFLRPSRLGISIHALLAESDNQSNHTGTSPKEFLSTLSLRRATIAGAGDNAVGIFLSTLSLRRATDKRCKLSWNNRDFYPRSPCGERREQSY